MPDFSRYRRGGRASALPEAYRVLRTNLLVALADLDHPIVMFTSAVPGEGKTSTVGNLTPLLALAGHRVIAVDFDLRNPDLHNHFHITKDNGVSEVLRGDKPLEECLHYIHITDEARPDCGLYVLPAGAATSDPVELIGSPRTARLLETLAGQADIVLLDAPPVRGFADALVLGRLASGVVLVTESRRTSFPLIQQAKDTLIRNQARLLGVVVSKLEPRDAARETSMGSYGYEYAPRGT